MKTFTKLGAFVVALVMVFACSYVVGRIVGPAPAPVAAEPAPAPADDHGPGGLAISAESLTLAVFEPTFEAGRSKVLAFQIQEREGTPLVQYEVQHDKLMHLIVARHDLSHFQHVHPELGADGTWRVPLTFPAAGEYRIFADFFPAWGTHPTTLGADVSVAGDFRPEPLPAPSNTATVDGYTVTLSGRLVPGEESELTLHVSRDGRPVTDLEPYLASFGHLVALRDGDMAYIHVHPDGHPGDGETASGPEIRFATTVPSYGPYRLYLDFQHGGVVRTAAFTVDVAGPNPPPHGLTPEEFERAKAGNLIGESGTGEDGGGHGGGEEGPGHGHGG